MNGYELRNVEFVDEEQRLGKKSSQSMFATRRFVNRSEGIRIDTGTSESKSVGSAFFSLFDYTVSTHFPIPEYSETHI